MKWKGNTLKTKNAVYRFKSSIVGCGHVGERIAVVLEKSIVFVEKTGDLIKYPTCRIQTSGFLKDGVVYSEVNSTSLNYITGPYEAVRSDCMLGAPFEIVAAHKDRYALLFQKDGKPHLNLYRGAPPTSNLLFSMPREGVRRVLIQGTRHAIVQDFCVIVCSLQRRSGESSIKHELVYSPMAGRVESVVPIKTARGAYFLVNGKEVISEYGLVLDLGEIPAENVTKYITKRAAQNIRAMQTRGYHMNEIENFFQYSTRGQWLFGRIMPSASMHAILHAHSAGSGQTLDELFSKELAGLSKKAVAKISSHLEKIVHIIRCVHNIKTPLFKVIARRNMRIDGKRAYLFWVLGERRLPKKALLYELFSYKESLVEKSRNLGYVLLRNDRLQATSKKDKLCEAAISHTLEDPEFIREVPSRLRNAGIIEECKRLLSGHQVGDFLFDLYDTESRRRKAFICSTIASVGRGLFLLNRNNQVNVFQVPQLKVFLKKNCNVVTVTDLTEWESMWPSFHFSVATSLSIPNRPFISTSHIEVMTPKTLMSLAGSIFGFGLKTTVCQNSISLGEKLSLSRCLILSLSRSHDSLLIAATILGNSFIIKGSGNKDHANIIWFNLRAKMSPGHLLMWSVFALGVLYMGQNDLFAKKALIEYMERKGPIISGSTHARKTYYDKYHRVSAAFAFSYIAIGSRTLEYERIPDRTCEIIVNGLVHMKSGREKIACLLKEPSSRSTPLNRFFSSLMEALVLGDTSEYSAAFAEALGETMSIETAHSVAGKIFAYGLLSIPEAGKKPNEKFVSDATTLLYKLERRNTEYSILLDYTLLACSLVLNSTGDLCVLGTCKRLLDSLKCIEALDRINDFSPFAGSYREQYGMRYGRIQHIKMCLAVIVPGCGSMQINPSQEAVAFIVTSFYPEFPITPEDQDAFQVVRHFYLLAFAPVEEESGAKVDKNLSACIRDGLRDAEKIDKKVAVDIITSYFEKHHLKTFDSNRVEELITNLYTDIL
ncbi:uncharacterized protein NEMAJ01_0301 [Nematocida major]|uniref:uncharacterized protein n=1 Tax=Nematocida major TaxID=1912982 RepID=UPI002008A4C2|nr:uncharacterized protein NEMAJ01_0301 [Nematocida major]KAH9385405.1 hypothetical protein NEMAJ01_0301 [Nematocida major]